MPQRAVAPASDTWLPGRTAYPDENPALPDGPHDAMLRPSP
ncbi:MAG: hypothetical protein NZ898_05385 [Myxococcota bacterium]|nr:hypothetical protein [Myxococcota bacterium]MDW8362086.1 hypothetical protein [Myxococcales bacterium]